MNPSARRGPPPLAAAVEAALDRLQAVWSQSSEDSGIPVSPSQLRALDIVATHGEINLGGLAAQLGTTSPATSRLCDRLQAAGLLERELSPLSRREVVLRLSRQGAQLLSDLRERRVEAVARVLARMTPASQKALVTGLLAFDVASQHQQGDWTGGTSRG